MLSFVHKTGWTWPASSSNMQILLLHRCCVYWDRSPVSCRYKGKCPTISHMQFFVPCKKQTQGQKCQKYIKAGRSYSGCLVNIVICSQCGSSASQLTSDVAHCFRYTQCHFWGSLLVCIQQGPTADAKGTDGNVQTEETALLNHCTQQPPEPTAESSIPARTWRQIFACPPQGLLAQTVTNGR